MVLSDDWGCHSCWPALAELLVADPVASLVRIANSRNVNWVFVDGKVKKRDGMLVDVDLVSLGKKMDESHAYLTKDVDGVK